MQKAKIAQGMLLKYFLRETSNLVIIFEKNGVSAFWRIKKVVAAKSTKTPIMEDYGKTVTDSRDTVHEGKGYFKTGQVLREHTLLADRFLI